MPQHPKTPDAAEEAWCLEALRYVKAGYEITRATRARLTAFGMLDGLGQPTPAGRALLALQEAEKGVAKWATCKHTGGWQFLSSNVFRCRDCHVLRSQPFGEAPLMSAVTTPGSRELELKARIDQLEAALKPFAEALFELDDGDGRPDEAAVHYRLGVPKPGLHLGDFRTAAQTMGLLDPEPEAVRAEVGLT
jgi:hypothetical protein